MAATQRPATQEALYRPVRVKGPCGRELPSSFVIAEEDRNIPAELQHFMAERAQGAQRDARDSRARPMRSLSSQPIFLKKKSARGTPGGGGPSVWGVVTSDAFLSSSAGCGVVVLARA